MKKKIERVLVVMAHPEPCSFNAQMKDVALEALGAQGIAVEVSDLYQAGFDPVESPRHFPSRQDPAWFRPQGEQRHAFEKQVTSADVREEIEKLHRADLVVLQYPMWWYGMPAILKGWVDRVLTYGGVYTSQQRYDRGLFQGKRVLLSVTAGAPETTYKPDGRNADIDLIMWPSCFTFYYVGFTVHRPYVSYSVEGGVYYSETSEMLERLRQHKIAFGNRLSCIEAETPMDFNKWADWNKDGRLHPNSPSYSPFVRHIP